ncbi:ribosome small subunit-dependent GTPase A [Virgibacillus phasianinus]|uniref:Small ribosomal subunit biogenesis GTPase RsgA n=1 Tax=Virgibacillus phasianinus TaxID=2017483 RepID=A0A220U742_9BACI|nr:ribosome small subunit-dependent GTPase A [Virgibacillus phasianinus]ASK63543.1 ribosome small subunit-dependent GTPase A [Virgibacillus phasianinus]
MTEGRIIKALSGFYYVQADEGVYQCRGRGLFRNKKITPLVGDFVEFDKRDDMEGYLIDIKPRSNELVRPPISNVDRAFIISSAVEPSFSTLLLDRFLVLIESKDIEPIVIISKMDVLAKEERERIDGLAKTYRNIGYKVEQVSSKEPFEIQGIEAYFHDGVSVIAGQSGVGKSSLLNALKPELQIKTNDISKSLGRGKHTTRHVELVQLFGGLVADTPGFSALEFNEIDLEDLGEYFPEIRERKSNCKFRGCMHRKEPKCAVKEAVDHGEISQFRYNHYLAFHEEIQSRKPRY